MCDVRSVFSGWIDYCDEIRPFVVFSLLLVTLLPQILYVFIWLSELTYRSCTQAERKASGQVLIEKKEEEAEEEANLSNLNREELNQIPPT